MKCKTIGVLALIGTLAAGFLPLSARATVTLAVMPEKILYAPGETAKIAVTLSNGTPESVKGTLVVKVLWEMEDFAKITEETVTLAPSERKTIAAEWKAADVLGCEVRADFISGTNFIVTAADYFNVCPAKDAQRVGIHIGWPDLFSWPGKDYLDAIPQKVENLRKNYVNIVENFGWGPDHFADLAPQEDVWCSGYWESKAALKKIVAEEHKHGIKAFHYLISLANYAPAGEEILRRHPEWFLYRENGQLWSDCDVKILDAQRNPDLRAGLYFAIGWGLSASPDFSLKAPLEYGVQQMIASKKMFDWDGVRFDGHYIMWGNNLPGARDITGKLAASGKAAEPIDRANTDYTRKTVAALYPDYLFMFNASSTGDDIAEICRDGGTPANEPIRTANDIASQWHAWKAFSQYLLDDVDAARKFGGYAYAFLVPAWHLCANADRIQYALLFAAGDHPWFCTPTTPYKKGPNDSVQTDYFRFATRFSAVLWGRGIERIKAPEDVVEVISPQGTIWWRDFVHQRKLANGKRQLVVHLVNAPPTPNIEGETQPLAAPVKDIIVKFKKPVNKVWVATAEPQLTYQVLPVNNGAVKVPELQEWSMVVAEMEGK